MNLLKFNFFHLKVKSYNDLNSYLCIQNDIEQMFSLLDLTRIFKRKLSYDGIVLIAISRF